MNVDSQPDTRSVLLDIAADIGIDIERQEGSCEPDVNVLFGNRLVFVLANLCVRARVRVSV